MKQKKRNPKTSKAQRQRLVDAKQNFAEIKKELAPFEKDRKIARYSTRGEWCDASCLELQPRS
ncbi:MAG: hypothetical protein AB1473_20960 [Thermodesulfobacteriota bacterium]